MNPLQPVLTSLPTLAVATMYCFWRFYACTQKQRERRVRDRVAYMLWVMANEVE